MTTETLGQLATAFLVVLGSTIAWFSSRTNRRAIEENTTITRHTHDIANGSYTQLLREKAELTRELANLTNREEHRTRAAIAERDLQQRLTLTAQHL